MKVDITCPTVEQRIFKHSSSILRLVSQLLHSSSCLYSPSTSPLRQLITDTCMMQDLDVCSSPCLIHNHISATKIVRSSSPVTRRFEGDDADILFKAFSLIEVATKVRNRLELQKVAYLTAAPETGRACVIPMAFWRKDSSYSQKQLRPCTAREPSALP